VKVAYICNLAMYVYILWSICKYIYIRVIKLAAVVLNSENITNLKPFAATV